MRKGAATIDKWFTFNKESTLMILVLPLSWLFFYVFAYIILPSKLFLLSLAIVLLPILGFLGLFFRTNEKVDDYFVSENDVIY